MKSRHSDPLFASSDRIAADPGQYPVSRRVVFRTLGALALPWLSQVSGAHAASPSLRLAAAAGYRRPMEALCAGFTSASGVPVERSYGSLAQMLAQIKAWGGVDAWVAERQFLLQHPEMGNTRLVGLGEGILALIWRPGLKLRSIRDIANLGTVAIPQPKQTIFGKAADGVLQSLGLRDALAGRLRVVSSVPQVVTYVLNGQADAGFVNLTEALALTSRLGGHLVIRPGEGFYPPIEIAAAFADAGVRPDTAAGRREFERYLQLPAALAVLRQFGLSA